MLVETKARIGVFSIALGAYLPQFPSLVPEFEGQYEAFKKTLIAEINALEIDGMPKVEKLNALVGSFVNLPYRLPNGETVRFLDDNTTYLGNQLPCAFDDSRCFGVLANMDFILICTYEADGKNPELVLYKKR